MGASLKTLKLKAARFCAYRERSVAEVKTKLQTMGASPTDIDLLIPQLIEENFIDESRYARAFVLDKFRFNKWGKVKIRQMLRQKQVDETQIDHALTLIPTGDYRTMIRQLVNQKLKTLPADLALNQKKQKVYRFLLQKGFEFEMITPQLEDLS